MLLDTSVIVLLFECLVLNMAYPHVKVGRSLQRILGVGRVGVCDLFNELIMQRCKGSQCFVSKLSILEFTKVFIYKSLTTNEYLKIIKNRNILKAPEDLLMALINVYIGAGVSLDLVEVEEGDLDKALEFLSRFRWDEREIRMKSFDILLFAQAVTRGVKLFTKDNNFLKIRESLFGLPAYVRDRKTGLKIYEDEYVLFISYAA
mgnify:CR=1 FL=1